MGSLAQALIYRAPDECERCPACESSRLFELDLLMSRRPSGGRRVGFVSGCNDCGLVFSNPQPSQEDQARFYSPSGEWGAPRAEGDSDVAAVKKWRGRGRWISQFDPIRDELSVTSPPPGARVLDFGCGSGTLLDSLQDCGWETWGIETAVSQAFRRHRRLETLPDDPRFDLIVANHVLEHVSNPLAILRQFARASKSNGFLLVGVPRLDTLALHRDYKYVINGRAHVTAYTWTCLRGLLARAGWSPVAPPPARVFKDATRQTYSRLRVLARRASEPGELPASAGKEARAAFRAYYKKIDGRSLFERLGFFRLAARRARTERRVVRPA